MANPQLENGFLRIATEIVEALYKINLSPYESRVVWLIIRKTYGWRKKMDRIPLSQFAKEIEIDRRNVHRTLRQLEGRDIIVVCRDDNRHISYGLQKNYKKWKSSLSEAINKNGTSTDDKVSPPQMTKLSPIQTPSINNSINTKQQTDDASFKQKKREIAKKLQDIGVDNGSWIIERYPLDEIERQLDYWPYRDKTKVRNLEGYFISAVERKWEKPQPQSIDEEPCKCERCGRDVPHYEWQLKRGLCDKCQREKLNWKGNQTPKGFFDRIHEILDK